jgi:hypothetical protein
MNNGEKLEYFPRAAMSNGETLEYFPRASMKDMGRARVGMSNPLGVVAALADSLSGETAEMTCPHCGRDMRTDCQCG